MSERFYIDDAGQLSCSLDTLVDTRLLVQANSGGGKSWAVRRVLERTHGRVQHLVLDPEGEFASLREGYDYVHAAPVGGDTVAHPRSAALLAERLLELRASAILDLYELKAHERVRFVRLFLEALIEAPKTLWHPVLVVVDESHVFCPQTGNAESAAAVIDLCSRGRKRGYAAVLATQRIAKLHKDAAAELNNKLIGRTTLDVDLARAADELGFPKARWSELKELSPGEFFASGPAFSKRGAIPVKVGSVFTTHPKAGARIAYKPPPPPSKIRALLPKLSDLPAEAEERVKTVEALRQENAQLKRELAAKPKEAAPKVVEVPVPAPGVVDQFERAKQELLAAFDEVKANMRKVDALKAAVTRVQAFPPTISSDLRRNGYIIDPGGKTYRRDPDAAKLSPISRAILTVLAQEQAAAGRPARISKERLAAMAGYSLSGHFNNMLGALRTAGRIDGGGEAIGITEAGLAALGDFTPRPRGHALLEWWSPKLSKIEREILAALAHTDPMNKERLAAEAGYSVSGHFNNMLGHLRTLGLVVGYGEDIRLAEFLRD